MKVVGDTVTFDDGTEVYANNGIIGLDPHGRVGQGSDGWLYWDDGGDDLTPAQRKELADYMVERWKKFGERSTIPAPVTLE